MSMVAKKNATFVHEKFIHKLNVHDIHVLQLHLLWIASQDKV